MVNIGTMQDAAASAAAGSASGDAVVSPVCGPNSSLSAGEGAAIKALLSASLAARLDFGDEDLGTETCEDSEAVIAHSLADSLSERRVTLHSLPMQSPFASSSPLHVWQQGGLDTLSSAEPPSNSLSSSLPSTSAGFASSRTSTTLGKRSLASSRGRTLAPAREDRPAAAAAAAMASMGVRKSSAKRARYDDDFKEQVVREAMRCPEGARIKPTCSRYPGVEPCQLRKWIQKFAPTLSER